MMKISLKFATFKYSFGSNGMKQENVHVMVRMWMWEF